MSPRLDDLRDALVDAQAALDALGEDPADEPAGAGYFADAATSGINAAIEQISSHDGEITVFVGAGVSKEAGLPSWNELVERLLQAAVDDRLSDRQVSEWLRRTLAEGPLAAAAIALPGPPRAASGRPRRTTENREAERFGPRAAQRLATARATFLPPDREAFLAAQSFLSAWLRERIDDVRAVASDADVDLTEHQLGLGLWGVDHDDGVLEQWALSHRELREHHAVQRLPMHYESRWIAVAAAINGSAVEQDPAVYTSRWRLVRGIPVIVAADTSRSVSGVLTLTSTVPFAQNPLARRNAPAGLLNQIDEMLIDAAAALFQ